MAEKKTLHDVLLPLVLELGNIVADTDLRRALIPLVHKAYLAGFDLAAELAEDSCAVETMCDHCEDYTDTSDIGDDVKFTLARKREELENKAV